MNALLSFTAMQKRSLALIAAFLVVGGLIGFRARAQIGQLVYRVRSPALPVAQPVDAFLPTEEEPFVPVVPAPININTAQKKEKATSTVVSAVIPKKSAPTPAPDQINLAVPFTSQAPFAVWDQPYQDGCEEASSAMVHYYYAKKQFASREEADAELNRLFDWQDATFGTNKDSSATTTARILTDYYGYKNVVVRTNITAKDIRTELAAGRPVIVPAFGKALKNPNFRNGGPVYHMLVIKGYIGESHFITNDPGTRNGADYTYTKETMVNALHDWNNGDVAHGVPAMIVVHR